MGGKIFGTHFIFDLIDRGRERSGEDVRLQLREI